MGGARLDSEQDVYPSIKTDGVYKCYYINSEDGLERNFLLQLECKLDIDFNNSADRAKVLLQVCCYLKQIHDEVCGFNGDWKSSDIPVVVVLGSKINCMALHTKWLFPFAQDYITGYKSASTAYTRVENKQLLLNIENNDAINFCSIIYNVNDKNCIYDICDSILKIGQGIELADDLTERNLYKAYEFFALYVLDKKQSSKITQRQKASLFVRTFYSEDFDEKKENRYSNVIKYLEIDGIKVEVDYIKYNNFRLKFNMRQYSGKEQKEITAITDRLIEDLDRRRHGDYYTPSIWVDEAHKLLSKNLGSNWKEEYMVWDCAWGTGNLTRDYRFKDLYCSTLYNEDLRIGERYNKNAVKFQYDFLNDDVEEFEEIESMIKSALSMRSTDANLANNMFESAINQLKATKLYKCAPGLIDGLMGWNEKEKKKLLFFINPPYGTSAELKNVHSDIKHKDDIADTLVNKLMGDQKIGMCSRQLVAQFVYRVYKISNLFNTDYALGLFSPTSVLTSNDYEGLLLCIDDKFGFTDGFMFLASEFADVKPNWGIMFSLYNTNNESHNRVCVLDVLSQNPDFKSYKKNLYMINKNDKASWWTKEPIKDIGKTKDTIYMKSALNVHTSNAHNMCINGSLGGFISSANNVNENNQFVALLSAMSGAAKSLNLSRENYNRVISVFTARRLITGTYATWINWQDEYMIPNINHPLYNQWQSDCIVYSLFNSKSNQSSLRNIEYNGKTWNIQNEFFWMSVRDIENLAGGLYDKADINTKIEDDIEEFGNERFVYKKLQEVELSPDAQAVLDKATELVKLSFRFRKDFNEKHPEYHINTWDAGWYQIKGMLKEYMPNELKEFNELYKAMEDRMRPLVYELGFLYR